MKKQQNICVKIESNPKGKFQSTKMATIKCTVSVAVRETTFGQSFSVTEFLVSKETVVLRRWERSKQKFGFIKWVDKGWITTVKDLESWRFEH